MLGRTACLALAGSGLASTALSHHDLSPLKLIPLEVHEGFDYVWGIGAIVWPLAKKHTKREPVLAVLHVVAGAIAILSALVTDYRTTRGLRPTRAT